MTYVRYMLLLLLVPLVCMGSEDSSASAQPFMVIVHSENGAEVISRKELAVVFLGKRTLWDNELRIIPGMLVERKKSMRQFIDAVLHKTLGQYRAYWKRRLFSGGGTVPRTFRTSGELIDFISRQPGAIGIVPAGTKLKEGVKAVALRMN